MTKVKRKIQVRDSGLSGYKDEFGELCIITSDIKRADGVRAFNINLLDTLTDMTLPSELKEPRRGRVFRTAISSDYGYYSNEDPKDKLYCLTDALNIFKRFRFYTSVSDKYALHIQHTTNSVSPLTVFTINDPQLCLLYHQEYTTESEIVLIDKEHLVDNDGVIDGHTPLLETEHYICFEYNEELIDIVTMCGIKASTPLAIPVYKKTNDEIAACLDKLIDTHPLFHYNIDN